MTPKGVTWRSGSSKVQHEDDFLSPRNGDLLIIEICRLYDVWYLLVDVNWYMTGKGSMWICNYSHIDVPNVEFGMGMRKSSNRQPQIQTNESKSGDCSFFDRHNKHGYCRWFPTKCTFSFHSLGLQKLEARAMRSLTFRVTAWCQILMSYRDAAECPQAQTLA